MWEGEKYSVGTENVQIGKVWSKKEENRAEHIFGRYARGERGKNEG